MYHLTDWIAYTYGLRAIDWIALSAVWVIIIALERSQRSSERSR